jgi:hypothetical protein
MLDWAKLTQVLIRNFHYFSFDPEFRLSCSPPRYRDVGPNTLQIHLLLARVQSTVPSSQQFEPQARVYTVRELASASSFSSEYRMSERKY